jgi:hypothetical protein
MEYKNAVLIEIVVKFGRKKTAEQINVSGFLT